MAVIPGDNAQTPIRDTYRAVLRRHEPAFDKFEFIERFAFYERGKKVYGVAATGEQAVNANIILKKSLVKPE